MKVCSACGTILDEIFDAEYCLNCGMKYQVISRLINLKLEQLWNIFLKVLSDEENKYATTRVAEDVSVFLEEFQAKADDESRHEFWKKFNEQVVNECDFRNGLVSNENRQVMETLREYNNEELFFAQIILQIVLVSPQHVEMMLGMIERMIPPELSEDNSDLEGIDVVPVSVPEPVPEPVVVPEPVPEPVPTPVVVPEPTPVPVPVVVPEPVPVPEPEPVPQPEPVPVLIPGPRGPEGPRGLPGRDGRDGVDGRDGSDGSSGSASAGYLLVAVILFGVAVYFLGSTLLTKM